VDGDVTIRPAGPVDEPAVVKLWTEAFLTGDPEGVSEPYTAQDFTDSAGVADIHVAVSGGAVIGVVALFDADHQGINMKGEAELARLAVTGAARRRGVGRALLEHCHEQARRRGCEAIVLWSGPHQIAGHRLYESAGYRRIPERDHLGEGGRRRLIFGLRLRNG
jgi:ribosomal protein S18 acetylase RimI-like enzyme